MATSTFTWLDHREEDAQRVREALAAFDQPGMIDPLGFGVVRDAFSELLFPGVSTVQTRARYFLFVPWVYQRLDEDGIRPADGVATAREWELDLIDALLGGSDDHQGVIGREARRETKQLPSQIYWGGLGRWDIRRFGGTRRDYVASLDRRRARRSRRRDHEDAAVAESEWYDLPDLPDEVFESCSLELTQAEAEYLRGRILAAVPDSFLADVVRDGGVALDGEWPWSVSGSATPDNVEVLRHAEHFSRVSWGANLLYNRELERRYVADGADDFGGQPDALLTEWLDLMTSDAAEVAAWGDERERFWFIVSRSNPRAIRLRPFVDWWIDVAIRDPGLVLDDSAIATELVTRESKIKGHRARLSSRRARETSSGMQGEVRMAYRWRQVVDIVGDVIDGLG